MRVFLDTNVLVSALTTRGLSADVLRVVLRDHTLLTGEFNLRELRRVLQTRMKAPTAVVDSAESLLREHVVVPKPQVPPRIEVRDPDDAWVLGSALAGSADVLVTGDRDLLALGGDAPLPILTPRGLWERLRDSNRASPESRSASALREEER